MAWAWTPCKIPHGGIGGVSRENLNSGDLDSTPTEKLYATHSQGVTTEQFGTGRGLRSETQFLGGGDDGGYHSLLGRRKARRLREKG